MTTDPLNSRSSQGLLRSLRELPKKLMNKASTAIVDWSVSEEPSTHPVLNDQDRDMFRGKLEPGDVLLVTNTESPILQALSYYGVGSHHTHCAIYTDNDSFIESQDVVVETPYHEFLSGKQRVTIVRPPYKSKEDAQKVVSESKSLLGTPYDYTGNPDDDTEVACTDLIEVAMRRVDPDLDVEEVNILGFEIVPPDGFLEMEGAQLIHDGKSNYWTNKLYQWPKHLLTVTGAVLGGLALGPAGALLGGIFARSGYMAATTHDGGIAESPLPEPVHQLVENLTREEPRTSANVS